MPKPLRWFVPSRDEIRGIPQDVRTTMGFKLRRLQNGEDADDKDIKRFGEDDRISNLVKIVAEGKDKNTYRTIATVQFPEGIWVLDVFEKRSSSGIETPKRDIDRIVMRLRNLTEFRRSEAGKAMIAGMNAEREAEMAKAKATSANPQRVPGVR